VAPAQVFHETVDVDLHARGIATRPQGLGNGGKGLRKRGERKVGTDALCLVGGLERSRDIAAFPRRKQAGTGLVIGKLHDETTNQPFGTQICDGSVVVSANVLV